MDEAGEAIVSAILGRDVVVLAVALRTCGEDAVERIAIVRLAVPKRRGVRVSSGGMTNVGRCGMKLSSRSTSGSPPCLRGSVYTA